MIEIFSFQLSIFKNILRSLLILAFYLLLITYYTPTIYAQITTSDEKALENVNRAILPDEISKEVKEEEKDFFSQLFEEIILNNILLQDNPFFILLGFLPKLPETLYPRSENQHQAELPPELKPEETQDPLEQIKGFLGEKIGFYNSSLPEEAQSDESVREAEESFEKATYPQEINLHPIIDK